jgi:hypothetical protein
VLGSRSTGIGTWGSGTAGKAGTLTGTTKTLSGTSGWTAIEDRLAALQSCCGWLRGRLGRNGRLINRARSGLRHHHAASRGNVRRRSGRSLRRGCSGRRYGWCRGSGLCRSCGCNRRRSFWRGRWSCNGLFGYRCGCFRRRRHGSCGCWGSCLRRNGARLFFPRRRRCYSWLDHHGARRRRNHNDRARRSSCTSRRLCHDSVSRGLGCDCRCRRRRNNGRSRARLRHNTARRRGRLRCSGLRCGRGRCCAHCGRGSLHGRSGRLGRYPRVARFFFLFLFLGQNRLHHIAGFGDVREVDFGCNTLLAAGTWRSGRSRAPSLLKVRTNLFGFICFERTGVGFTSGYADFRKNVQNRARLNFQLFREIVNTNLTHPPLFNIDAAKSA